MVCLIIEKWPFMWTRITESHMSSVIFTIMPSREKPALLTMMLRSPKASTALRTILRASSQSATSPKAATALAPRASISLTTAWAGSSLAPLPSA